MFRRSLASLRRGQGFEVEDPCRVDSHGGRRCEKRIVPQRFLPQPFLFHEMAFIEPKGDVRDLFGVFGKVFMCDPSAIGADQSQVFSSRRKFEIGVEIADPVGAVFSGGPDQQESPRS